ncbi:hypothetical protein NEOLEDRAFT_1028359, partial [Neolentinus lepideus HHB14362 ss-1]
KPLHTSAMTGERWLSELLERHPERFRRQMGMPQAVFHALHHELVAHSGLQSSRWVASEEKLAIFCY